jgi:hypothetical protein
MWETQIWEASIFTTFYGMTKVMLYAFSSVIVKVEVKQSLYRAGQAVRVPGGWGSQISRQLAYEGAKVVSPMDRPPLTPRKYSWYSFLLRGWADPRAIVRPEGLCQWKIPLTPLGIEPPTFQLVAQCFNQLRHCVCPIYQEYSY